MERKKVLHNRWNESTSAITINLYLELQIVSNFKNSNIEALERMVMGQVGIKGTKVSMRQCIKGIRHYVIFLHNYTKAVEITNTGVYTINIIND